MERFFQIVAVILAGVAAYFLWSGNGDGAFVAGVLGAVSFFLSFRFQVKNRLRQREADGADRENSLAGSDSSGRWLTDESLEEEIFVTNDEPEPAKSERKTNL